MDAFEAGIIDGMEKVADELERQRAISKKLTEMRESGKATRKSVLDVTSSNASGSSAPESTPTSSSHMESAREHMKKLDDANRNYKAESAQRRNEGDARLKKMRTASTVRGIAHDLTTRRSPRSMIRRAVHHATNIWENR